MRLKFTSMAAVLPLIILLLFSLNSPVVLAVPTNTSALMGSICEWGEDVFPIFYQEYGESSCPAKFHVQPSGECEPDLHGALIDSDHQDCGSFCQMRTSFIYGEEQPYMRLKPCRGPMSCSLSEAIHQGYNKKGKLTGSVGTKKILNVGINGGYNSKGGISQTFKVSVKLKANECGYLTFVPFAKDTCGTFTQKYLWYNDPKQGGTNVCRPGPTTGNYCAYQVMHFTGSDQYKNWDTVRGMAILVRVDCGNMKPLKDGQDAAWYKPGVPTPRDTPQGQGFQMMLESAINNDLLAQADGLAGCLPDRMLNATACFDVLQDMYLNPARPVLVPTKGAKAGTGIEISGLPDEKCHVYLSYDEDWKDDCKVPLMEVAAAAQGIFDSKCLDASANTVSGNHIVRGHGNCASTVWLLREGMSPWGIDVGPPAAAEPASTEVDAGLKPPS